MASLAPEKPIQANDDALGDLAARWAITTNLARHSRGVDRNDFDLLSSAYHPDGEVAYGMFTGPARDFARFLTDALNGAPVTLHRTANMLIKVDGDRARSESYIMAYTRTPEGDGWMQRLIGGRYLDRHERRGDEWRLAHRTYVLDWNVNVSNRELPDVIGRFGRGAQREDDRAYALFAGLRAEKTKGDTDMIDVGVEEAITKQALHDLVMTYARGVDRGDEKLLASVFHPDAEVITGVLDAKAPIFARDIVAGVRSAYRSAFHSVANEYYEVSGDHAAGECYVVAHTLSAGDDPQETLTGGRYLDRYEKRDGAWKIAHRTFVCDWTMTQPSTREDGGMYESLTTRGGYAPDDPSIAFFAGA